MDFLLTGILKKNLNQYCTVFIRLLNILFLYIYTLTLGSFWVHFIDSFLESARKHLPRCFRWCMELQHLEHDLLSSQPVSLVRKLKCKFYFKINILTCITSVLFSSDVPSGNLYSSVMSSRILAPPPLTGSPSGTLVLIFLPILKVHWNIKYVVHEIEIIVLDTLLFMTSILTLTGQDWRLTIFLLPLEPTLLCRHLLPQIQRVYHTGARTCLL